MKALEAAEKETLQWEEKLEEQINQGNYDEKLEKVCDEKYNIEFAIFTALAKKIADESKSRISFQEAKKMLKDEREKVRSIIERISKLQNKCP